MSVTFASPRGQENGLLLESEGARARSLRGLRQLMTDGTLPVGQPLPGERELAQQLGVNRTTVRAALSMLEEEGWFRSNGGRLRIVQAPPEKMTRSRVMASTFAVLTHFPDSTSAADAPSGGSLSEITRGIFQEIARLGRNGMALHANWLEEHGADPLLEGDRLGGVIFADFVNAGENTARWAEQLSEGGVPVSIFGDGTELDGFDHVMTDHESGGYELTRWLIEQGRTRLLSVWPAEDPEPWQEKRLTGIERALRENDLGSRPVLHYPTTFPGWWADDAECARQIRVLAGFLAEFLHGPDAIDGILALTDGDAMLCRAACRLLGRADDEIAVVGYDNFRGAFGAAPLQNSLPDATMDKNNNAIGCALVDLLRDRIRGDLPPTPQSRVVAPHLVVAPNGSAISSF